MENIKLKIREHYNQMSKAEKRISDFVLANVKQCLSMTAVDIARGSGVSSASVIRYVQKLGFDGLEAFKLALASVNSQDDEWVMVDPIISKEDDLESLSRKLEVLIQTSFKDFFYQLDKNTLEQAIQVIKKSRRIYLLGIGASMMPAYDLFHKLKRANLPAEFYFDVDMVVEFLNYVDERDAVIAFSYGGQSKQIVYACEMAAERKARVIAITRNHPSPLQRIADICLYVPDKEAVMRIGAFTSLHNSIMMADLLYLGTIGDNLEEIEVELVKTRKLVEGMKTKIE